nr:hypothetical protein [Gordonia sp. (in: high G+C Gram-positive bacteria)]
GCVHAGFGHAVTLKYLVVAGVEPVMGAVPALGEHTDEIMAGLGIAESAVAAWREQGAFGTAKSDL